MPIQVHGVLLPTISNSVGSVKLFLSVLLRSLPRVVLFGLFDLCIDDQGSLVIFRAVSVRPIHLFDLYLDHDYLFKLPLQGAGCPFRFTVFYCPPLPIPSFPACEPNSRDGEYSWPFRHIQYKRAPILRPIATLAMFRCRRMARCR